MSTPKRYTIHGLQCDDGAPLPAQDFVRAADYDALQVERDKAVRFLYELSEASHRRMAPTPLAAIDDFLKSLI